MQAMTNDNVFEQYQKYFDSLNSRYKEEAGNLDNQNHQQQPDNIIRQPVPQNFNGQPDGETSGQSLPQHPQQHYFNGNASQQFPDYIYCGRNDGQAPMMPPPPPQSHTPQNNNQRDNKLRNNYYTNYAHPLQQHSVFRPDGRCPYEMPPPDECSKKSPTFCYPYSVDGYSDCVNRGPCGCGISNNYDPSKLGPESLQQKLESRRRNQPTNPWSQIQQQQLPYGQQQMPCVQLQMPCLQQQMQPQMQQPACRGNDCQNAWLPAFKQPDSRPNDRLPLNVYEPFMVGPTTYQYFYDVSRQ